MCNHRCKQILLLAGLVAATPALAQTVWYVNANQATGLHNGTSWEDAFLDLQDALLPNNQELGLGDQIWVAKSEPAQPSYKPSVRYPNDSDSRHATFFFPKTRQIYGGFLGISEQFPQGETSVTQRNPEVNLTVLDGDIGLVYDPQNPNPAALLDNAYHVCYFQDTDDNLNRITKLSGFVIRNGRADGDPQQPATRFDSKGGGVLVLYSEAPASTSPLLDRLVMEHNVASEGGAGIYVAGKAPTYLANCVLRHNRVLDGYGGGLLCDGHGSYQAQNCVFYDNECITGSGGGAGVSSGVLVNCTFYDNRAENPNPSDGAGGAFWGPSVPRPSSVLSNCIVWENTNDQVMNINVYYCDVQDGSGLNFPTGNNIMEDPRFRNAPTDLSVIQASPCVDTGLDEAEFDDPPGVRDDNTDVDQNNDFSELMPWDEKKIHRIIRVFTPEPDSAGDVDRGAWELCAGDVNGDGLVSLSDLTLLLSAYGTVGCSGVPCWSDLEPRGGDSDVDLNDLTVFLSSYGTDCHPEPPGFDAPQQEDPLTAWIQSASPEEILEWWGNGMPWP